ncbi:MAG: hypothetical protein ACT4PV_04685 [Planctomycetaceae bacterium]
MAAEHRIIGGGLLIGGVLVVVALLLLFNRPGMAPEEAADELLKAVQPKFEAADEAGEYLAMRNEAKRALELLDAAGPNLVLRVIQTLATGDPKAAVVQRLIETGAYAKAAEDRFAFDDQWYSPAPHRALTLVRQAAEGASLKNLRAIRDVAKDLGKALEDARKGSGQPIEPPLAPPAAGRDLPAPIVELLAADAELFRSFALPHRALKAALRAPDPGGEATSARERWNRDLAASGLPRSLKELDALIRSLREGANALEQAKKALREHPEARAAATLYLKRAGDSVASGLAAEARAALHDADALARFLAAEADLLQPASVNARELGEFLTPDVAEPDRAKFAG